ncbi:hypothetical protein K458DRAFT_297507, partial [Lentithecium fluviatile CBS 122367]
CKHDGSDGIWVPERIPSNHPIFNNPVLPVPVKLSIPIVIHCVGTQSNNRAYLDCKLATFLNISRERICAASDKKPLSAEHFQAVSMFINHLQDTFGAGEDVQDYMTQEEFEEWFDNYKSNQAENGKRDWETVGSIYA